LGTGVRVGPIGNQTFDPDYAYDSGTVGEKLQGLVTATTYGVPTDGSDAYAALTTFIAAVRTKAAAGGMVSAHIPACAFGRYNVSAQLLFNVSNVIWWIGSPIYSTSTARAHTLLFAYDANQAPAQSLSNVWVMATPGTIIDGNGDNQVFSYTPGDGSINTSTVHFNKVDGFYCKGLRARNGPIDSFSVRQCRKWEVSQCRFSTGSQTQPTFVGNGFSATTDWTTYSATDADTWGGGLVSNCYADLNSAFGMTAFNCTGVKFRDCVSYGNGAGDLSGGGYSYEKSASDTFDAKKRFGGFYNCKALNNKSNGAYIDALGITWDDDCEIDTVTNHTAADPNGIYGNGVVFSLNSDCYAGGKIKNTAKAGVAVFNGSGVTMSITVGADVESAGTNSVYSRGASVLRITSRFQSRSSVSTAIVAGNLGGASYQEGGSSTVIIEGPSIRDSGARAWDIDYVGYVFINDVNGYQQNQVSGSTASEVRNCTLYVLTDNVLADPSGNQAIAFSIPATVAKVVNAGNWGNASASILSNLAVAKVGYGSIDVSSVASLPTAASSAYSRRFVSDATATTYNSVVAGGGANKVPVYSDGANWRIG
jgi:hypothetical protein